MGKLQAADYLEQFPGYQSFQTQDAHIPEWWEMHPETQGLDSNSSMPRPVTVSSNPDTMQYELAMKGK
jgi:hypothetical protein